MNVIRCLRKISQDSSSLVNRSHQASPLDMLHAGGIWNGDILVADVEDLESLDLSGIHARRLNAKEVLMPKNSDNFKFPVADGTVRLVWRDQVFRKSISIQDHPARDEEHNDVLQGESDGSPPFNTLTDGGEARNDFWTIAGNYIYRHHVEPRVELYVPKEGWHLHRIRVACGRTPSKIKRGSSQ